MNHFRKELEELGVPFEEESPCGVNPLTGTSLRADFFIPEINAVIEIDGKQHFTPVAPFGGQEEFEKTVWRDSIKNRYCLDSGIEIIRFPLVDVENIFRDIPVKKVFGDLSLLAMEIKDRVRSKELA